MSPPADMTLSQSLGGLRVTNPDDDATDDDVATGAAAAAVSNAARPPPPESHNSADTLTAGRGGEENVYISPSPASSQRDVAARAAPTYPPPYPPQGRAMRPVSELYMQPNTSSSSHVSSSTGSYRYRDGGGAGSSDGSVTGLARNGSRSAALVREGSTRTYRQPSGHGGGTGPLPPRRNSKRVRAPEVGGYDIPSDAAGAYRSPMRPPIKDTEQHQAQQQPPPPRAVKKGVQDFTFGRTLGEGSYSTVLAATDRQTLKEYAIKVLDKRHIIKEKKVKYVNIERDTLNRLTEHPGIVRLYYTFQDERSLYFVLDLASGGELLGVLKKLGSFDVECTRFYAAQILDSVAYMHSRGVIHRDLKPENVLLDREMHVKITDFGTAKILPEPPKTLPNGSEDLDQPIDGSNTNSNDDRAVSFVGTAEYVSPELLRDKTACKASDLWAFGCIVYQLLAGRPPFKAANEYLTFQKILGLEYTFPPGFPPDARDLVERLLVLEPERRLGMDYVKGHKFFEGIIWGKGLWKTKAPRLKAYVPPSSSGEPIRLNGAAAAPPPTVKSSTAGPPPSRPQLRGVTELPPPSQLDIDWSPVLTRPNERIIKLGNLLVGQGPAQASPGSPGGENEGRQAAKFRSFFGGGVGGGGRKQRERLVLITSAARLIVAAAGGNEKKAKLEVDLGARGGARWAKSVDGRGVVSWVVDTRDKHLTFDLISPAGVPSDPTATKYNAEEWLEALGQAREMAASAASSTTSSYSGPSAMDAEADADSHHHASSVMNGERSAGQHQLRQTMRGEDGGGGGGGVWAGRKRFSKRHSKSGLAAVF
ncbi:hypothetical protein M433DRAFT_59160 [Acidomyces richmondensis BFW]|nr:hypothetical protein M433DRAFT_59160 [Acidomyces richmondensis BFW]